MRSFPLLSSILFASALCLPAQLAGQASPLSEVFPVAWPETSDRATYTGYTINGPNTFLPGFPLAAALRHGFAVASLGSTSKSDAVVDGKLVDLSGQPGPKFLGNFLSDGSDPILQDPALAALGSEGFVLVWVSFPYSIAYRRFGPGGVPLKEIEHATADDGDLVDYYSPAAAGNASGAFAIVWEEDYPVAVWARAFYPSGEPATAEISIPTSQTSGFSFQPRVGIDAAGRFVVLWRQPGATAADPARLCGQAYGARGGFLGSRFCIGDLAGATGGALAVDPAGSFLAAWFGPPAAGAQAPLFVRRYQMDGKPLGSTVQVAAATNPRHLTASADGRGNAALAWREGDQMRVLLVRRDAVAKGPAITISGVGSGPEPYANGVALADSGRLLVTWLSGDQILGRLWLARY